MKRISIIMPVYNEEKYIKRCIKKYVIYANFELIIINDGSKDKTSEVIKNNFYDKRITLIEKNKIGKNKAFNLGYEFSSGELITYFAIDENDKVFFRNEVKSFNKTKKIIFLLW